MIREDGLFIPPDADASAAPLQAALAACARAAGVRRLVLEAPDGRLLADTAPADYAPPGRTPPADTPPPAPRPDRPPATRLAARPMQARSADAAPDATPDDAPAPPVEAPAFAGAPPRGAESPAPHASDRPSGLSVPVMDASGRALATLQAPGAADPALADRLAAAAPLVALALETGERLAAARTLASEREAFLNLAAHDLRNPVAALGAGLRIIDRTGATTPELLDEMARAVERALAVLSDLTHLTRGRLSSDAGATGGPVDLDRLIRAIAAETRAALDLCIRLDVAPGLAVAGDSTRLGQLVASLLSNAAARQGPGGEILVTARASDDVATLAVLDRGGPVSDRLHAALARPHADLGLDLFAAATIAAAHGGTLACDTDDGWTRFAVALPLAGP